MSGAPTATPVKTKTGRAATLALIAGLLVGLPAEQASAAGQAPVDAQAPAAAQAPTNDYPTAARAEYVFACMGANGQTSEVLRKCSCALDVIASMLPYEQYERAETVMRMQSLSGDRGVMFKETGWAKSILEAFKRAQAEATLSCF